MTTSNALDRVVFFHDVDVIERSPSSLGEIAEAMDVVVPDYPGFEGCFDDLDGDWQRWDSAIDLAHHFRGALVTPSAAPIHLIGAGFGGWVALELALLAPTALASLVLVGPYGVKLFGPTDPEFADVLLLDAQEQVDRGWADPDRCWGLRMPGFPADLPDEQHEIAFAERATVARYAWKPFLHSRRLSRWFHTIDVPTLIVSGAQDRMLREGHSRALADQMPNARYVEILDSGHYPYLEQPESFQATLSEFYSALKGERR